MKASERFNETAKAYQNFIVEELQKIDRLQPTDKPIIEGLAFYLAMVEDAQEQIMKKGSVIDGIHGPRVNPSVDVLNRSQAKVNEAYKVLGLDSGMRLKIESKGPKDDWGEFL